MGLLSQILANKARLAQNQQDATLVEGLLGTEAIAGQHELPVDQAGPQILGTPGSGLLGSSQFDQGQRDQLAFAGGLLQGEGTQATGSTLLRGVFADAAAAQRQSAGDAAALERTDLSSGRTRNTSLENAAANRKAAEAEFQREQTQKADIAASKARALLLSGDLAGPEPGMVRLRNEQGQVIGDAMIPGSNAYRKVQRAAVDGRALLTEADDILSQVISAAGPEAFGETAGRMRGKQEALRSKLRELLGLGVINSPAELERLESVLPDITALSSGAGFKKKSEIIGAYSEFRDTLARQLGALQTENRISQIPELLDPFGANPADVQARATEQGLTPVDRGSFTQRGLLGDTTVDPDSPARARFRRR